MSAAEARGQIPDSVGPHRLLLIVPGPEAAAARWRQDGIGNWAAAFPLRLERAGLLDFETADEAALDDPRRLADRDLVIIANLPGEVWTTTRQRVVRSLPCAVFVEGPVPGELAGAELAALGGGGAAILMGNNEAPVPLDIVPALTRPMRPYARLAPRAADTGRELPLPPPTTGIRTDLAPAEAWYRGPEMGGAFARSASGEVLARRAADGAAVILRTGNFCVSAIPLLGWLCQSYATPPLDGTFLNRPMRHVKRLEAWLVELLLHLAADARRPLLRVAAWPNGAHFACTIAHDVDRIPKPHDFDRLLGWEQRAGVKSSWYWIYSRLDPVRMQEIAAAGFENGLHGVLAARKFAEIEMLNAASEAAGAIRGETLHGGDGGDYWRGAASVLQAKAAGLTYTEHCPTAHDLPDTGYAVLREDGMVEPVSIVGLTHAVCLERNPEKEEEVYQRESLNRLAAAGGYCLISNHPDMSFDALCEWVEGLPLERAWHGTAAEVAAWWQASHSRSALSLTLRRTGGEETEVTIAARESLEGLVLRLPLSARLANVKGGRLLAQQGGEASIAIDIPAGETRTVCVCAYDRPRRVAIIHPTVQTDPRQLPAMQQALKAAVEDPALVHLSYRGRHLDLARAAAENPAFLFTPLVPPADQLLALSQTIGLYPNGFTAAWLGTLLIRGETQEILVGRGGGKRGQKVIGALRDALPAASIDDADRQWLRLRRSAELTQAVAAIPTAYPFLHGAFPAFRALYEGVAPRDAGEFVSAEGPAEATFRYSLLGASRNSFILECIADRLGWAPQPRLLDVGGGHGFLGLEMAAKGWSVTVVDHDPAKTELVGPWLARRSQRPLPIEYLTMEMESLDADDLPGLQRELQAITFFNSLYTAKRDRVGAILQACWELLAPGGALVIVEAVRQKPDEHLHEMRFSSDELINLTMENTVTPNYLSLVDGSSMPEFRAGASALILEKTPSERQRDIRKVGRRMSTPEPRSAALHAPRLQPQMRPAADPSEEAQTEPPPNHALKTSEALELMLPVLRYKAQRFDELEPGLAALRQKASSYDELQEQLPALRTKAERADALERQLPGLRQKAARCDELERELPPLRQKAEQFDALQPAVPVLRFKAERFDALEPDLPVLRQKSGRCDELERELAELREKAARYFELAVEVPVLRLKAGRYDALEPELPSLRQKAARQEELERELPELRMRAARQGELERELPELHHRAAKCAELEREAPLLRDKAERYGAVEPELAALREKAQQHHEIVGAMTLLRHKAERYDALEAELPGLRYRAERYAELEQEVLALRQKAAQYDRLEGEVRQGAERRDALERELRDRAERLSELEREVPALRQKAARYDRLEAEVPMLRQRSDRCDALEMEVSALRARAERFNALEVELPRLRQKAVRCDRLEAELPALRQRSERCDALELEVPTLRARAERLNALEGELPGLRYRAECFSNLEEELPGLRQKASRCDELKKEIVALRDAAERCGALERELSASREQVGRYEAVAIGMPELRQQAARCAELEGAMPLLRDKAERYDVLEAELPGLRRQAERLAELEQDLPALRERAERCAELERELPLLRDKAKQSDALGTEVVVLREQAKYYGAIAPELPALLDRAERYGAIEPELPALRYKAAQLGELQIVLPALRYKALRYDELKAQLPVWRAKANRLDRMIASRRVKIALVLLGVSSAGRPTAGPRPDSP